MTLWIVPLLPLAGALLVLISARVMTRARATLLGAEAVGTLVLTLLVAVWAAGRAQPAEWPWWGPHLRPYLAVDGLGQAMVVLVPVIAAPVVVYAAASMRADAGLPRLLALLVAFTGIMELLVLARDFLTLLVAWELVGACSWALIGYAWRDEARPRAAREAFLVTRAGDLGLYLAAAATFTATGSVRFEALGRLTSLGAVPAPDGAIAPVLHVIAAGVVLAAAAKSAQLPFAPWLFSAMAGPTPASALLHSATMVAAGAFLLVQLAPMLGVTGWFGPTVAGLGLATAVAGGIVASLQSDLKKALAASTSAQFGLMFVAIGAGFTGAAGLHLVTHAAFKALLFLGSGIALHAAGTLDLDRLRLGHALPTTARLFAVGALALAAVPPLGAAYSKEQIVAAAADAPFGHWWLVSGVLAAAMLSAFYAGRLYLLTFGPADRRISAVADRPRPSRLELASVGLLAALSAALGILWLPDVARLAVTATGGRLAEGAAWEMVVSLVAIVLAASTCLILWRRGALYTLGVHASLREQGAAWLGLPRLARATVIMPGLRVARLLAEFDDRVVDAGIRAAVRVSTLVSRSAAWWGERGVDGVVTAFIRVTERAAYASRIADDHAIDGAVEGVGQGVGAAGRQSRRLQTGFAHHYYVIVAVGVLVIAIAAAFGPLLQRLPVGR